jgi:hypothetical protein
MYGNPYIAIAIVVVLFVPCLVVAMLWLAKMTNHNALDKE